MFLEPGHLDRFEDLFVGMFRVIIEIFQLANPGMQVGKADILRVHVTVFFFQFYRVQAKGYIFSDLFQQPMFCVIWYDFSRY